MTLFSRTLSADNITPVQAYASLRSHAPSTSSFLLESVVPGERWGRYSIIGYRTQDEWIYPSGSHPLHEISLSSQVSIDNMGHRIASSIVGYIAYDAIHPAHRIAPWPNEEALGRFMRGFTTVLFDNVEQTVTVVAAQKDELDRAIFEMTHGALLKPIAPPNPHAIPQLLDISDSDESFCQKVLRAKEYIYAGDAFQIVLSRTFRTPIGDADPFAVYRAMRVLSPSPYLYFLDFVASKDCKPITIIGASPETMVRYDQNQMTLRPIAGTRPRGRTAEEDEVLAKELLADPKERAEHVMLIDLARNDVGRVCKSGSVKLTANMTIEKYSHVMHIVSEVIGTPRDDVSSIDIIRSSFPAGTLSGAPKVRATQIIRELESRPRGVFGGAIGYLSPDGKFDLAIAIRTVVAQNGFFEVSAGAGIVEGSDPMSEAQETRNKARAGLAAIAMAQNLSSNAQPY